MDPTVLLALTGLLGIGVGVGGTLGVQRLKLRGSSRVSFGSNVAMRAHVGTGGGRNVNIWFSNWSWTGSSVLTPQAELDVTIQWTDSAGVAQEHIETVRFPNILADVPIVWVKNWVEDGLLKALRVKAGVD